MRIVGGEWRGRGLEAPRGREVSRPTTDRVREAMASMVDSALDRGIEGTRVLDAFAGTGALGIEMLSRGAANAVFYDMDRGAVSLIRRNLAKLGCAQSRYRVYQADCIASARRGMLAHGNFNLVMMDPPYALGTVPAVELLGSLASTGSLAAGSLALFERSSETEPLELEGFERIREKRYGTCSVDLLRYLG